MPRCWPMVAIGGVALMVFFRDRGWHWVGGLIAALAFSYGASMAWRIQHTGQVLSLAYLPIALVCLDRALRRSSILYGAAAGLAAAVIALGRDQVALLGIYLLAAFAVWCVLSAEQPRVAVRKSLLPLGAGALCALAIVAIPVALTAALAQESNRVAIDYVGAARGSLHPALLLTLVMPDVFGAAGRMEDYWGPPSFAWPRYRPLHRPEHGPALHRRHSTPAAADGRRARPTVGPRDPLLHMCSRSGIALRARLVHAGLPRPLYPVARCQPLPPAGRRDVSGRRAGRDPGGLWCASPGAGRLSGSVAQSGRSWRWRRWRWQPALPACWDSGSADCRGCRCRSARLRCRLRQRRWRWPGRRPEWASGLCRRQPSSPPSPPSTSPTITVPAPPRPSRHPSTRCWSLTRATPRSRF